ncbi:MAG TPA: putative sugar nucleotidyl transferase [Rubricoccaceae bacterium]|jgi:UDP-N-acetylglucosamine diphosphorylase/glucosamine-1-phosphate N-acetyltransferase
MTLCLFEDALVAHLAPLALTRAACDLRVGARTLGEAAVALLAPEVPVALLVRPEVAGVAREEHPDWTVNAAPAGPTLFVSARWLARPGGLAAALVRIARDASEPARAFVSPDGTLLALWHPDPPAGLVGPDGGLAVPDGVPTEQAGAMTIDRLWDVVADLPARIEYDVYALGRLGTHEGATVADGAHVVAPHEVFLGAGVTVRAGAVIDASDGPVHLAAGVTVESNAVLRGPLFLGPKCVVKAAARVDGSAAGEQCRLGGEIHESTLHSFASKGHDGYLGNSALGRWVNLGAATDTSNLKNDYGEVAQWDAVARDFVPSGRQFLGLVMGDHSKCAIHTAFSTGTVVGVFANVFGSGVPPRHVPSFAWGGGEGLVPYRIDKALRVAEAVEARRGRAVSDAERALLTHVAASPHALAG